MCNVLRSFSFSGILVIGRSPYASKPAVLPHDEVKPPSAVEFWSPTESCVLKDYPRDMSYPTVNLVSHRLGACYEDTCEIYREGSWQHLQNTTVERHYHSSATTKDAVLLIGGIGLNSTEWIPIDGSPAQPGPFTVRGFGHCTIQTSDDVIVVTGGIETYNFVTQYHLTDGTETPLAPLGQPRWAHACGVYQDTNGQQVSESFEDANNANNACIDHVSDVRLCVIAISL